MQSLHSLLYEWLSTIRPDVEWYRAEQNNIPPARASVNFGTYNVISTIRQGIDGASYEYESGIDKFKEKAFSFKEIVVQLDVYTVDPSAEDIANEVLTSLWYQDIKDLFYLAGYSFLTSSNIRNLTELHSTRWIKRFSVDLHIGSRLQFIREIDRIVEFNFEGQISREGRDALEIEFTIDDP
jgi:hypothetical protein